MKVICINHDLYDDSFPYGPGDPQIGEVCEVVRIAIGYTPSNIAHPCFELAGYSEFFYDQRNFSTLDPDLDETTLVNHKPELLAI